MRTVVVLNGGPVVDGPLRVPDLLGEGRPDLVVAADSGLHLGAALGLDVDVVVGDMDSVDPSLLAATERRGAQVRRAPSDKDLTDLELALDAALTHGAERVVVVGSSGGRLDHLLATVAVLASPQWAAVAVDAALGSAQLHVVRGRRSLACAVGETVSLLPVGGPALGVRTDGLRWVLDGEPLEAGAARGVSNETVADRVDVEVAAGCVVVVRPGVEESDGGGVRP